MLVFPTTTLIAQNGNEWINYEQQYWTFQIVEDGIYKINREELEQAGFPVDAVNPRAIKLYGRGKEVPLYFPDEEDGSLDPGDKFYFYAQANGGWLDSLIYKNAPHTNPHYSLFTDTARYYLSFSELPNGLRMTESSSEGYQDFNSHPYLWKESLEFYTDRYYAGDQDVFGISLPWYQEAEGFFDNRFGLGVTRSKDIPTPLPYQNEDAPNPIVTAVSASASLANTGLYNHHLQVGYGESFTSVIDTAYFGYQLNEFEFEIPNDALGNTTRISHRSVDDLNVATDFHAISHIAIKYPHQNQVNELPFSFKLDDVFGNSTVHLELLGNVSSANAIYRINEQGFAVERTSVIQDNGLHALVSLLEDEEEFLLANDEGGSNVENLSPVNNNGFFDNLTAEPLDSAFVIVSHESLMIEAENYGQYRRNQGMDVLVVDVENLYHQYAFGVDKHPLAIRNFCKDLLEEWEVKPSHLFIIGKAIRNPSISNTLGSRKSPEFYHQNLVPTWGYPSSDIAITAGISGGSELTPAIPTGRLAATSGAQVTEYLNKVIEHEQQERDRWMKRILHFGGGYTEFEQNLFAEYLDNYKTMIEDTCFGADIHTFLKTTADPIQINLSDSIRFLIEDGVNIMTFFGHATSSGFDQNIDSPENYNNQGRYPMLIGNSCYTGNIHLPSTNSTSENFVLFPNGGMIGFLAKGDLGSPFYLDLYTTALYEHFGKINYGASIGQCMQYTVNDIDNQQGVLYLENTALTFGLHGDPAIRLYPADQPDFSISEEDIYFDPPRVTADVDSFNVVVKAYNIGKAVNGSLSVEVLRRFPNGETEVIQEEFDELFFEGELRFRFPTDIARGIGMNSFDLSLDLPADLIAELDDFNNNVVSNKELLITSGDLVPVFPSRYAVVPENDLELKASTGNAFEQERNYRIQLDTVPGFNSAFLQQSDWSQSGGIVRWSPNLLSQDSVVYYWRSASIPDEEEDFNWRNSSFQYIAGEEGWGQAHPGQFQENALFGGAWDGDELVYPETTVDLFCRVYGNANTNFESLDTHYRIDLDIQDYSGCGVQPAIHVAIIDSVSLAPWQSNYDGQFPQWDFGNLMTCTNSRQRPEKYFIFRQNSADQLSALDNLLNNEIPDGNYLLVYSWRYVSYDDWEDNAPQLFNTFESLGATQIGAAQDSVPFIFFRKMGDDASTVEIYGQDIDDVIELQADLSGSIGLAQMNASQSSQALNWNSVHWDWGTESPDSLKIQVNGWTNNSQEVLLDSFTQNSGSWNDPQINETLYPRLSLSAELKDEEELSPPQPRSWHILHDPVPEAALNAQLGFYLSADTVMEGEEIEFAIAIENISEVNMDSLLVSYRIEDSNNEFQIIEYGRQDSLRSAEVLLDTLRIPTFGLNGDNLLWIEVNPSPENNGIYDQPEQSHFNNLGQIAFHVINDEINPVLDVTFDGRQLLDGELVSAKPEITISLKDENPFFLLNEEADTSNFKLFISYPESEPEPIYFASSLAMGEMEWIPSDGTENRFKIFYRPELREDGSYRLLVQANDKSGNPSGIFDYEINFEIQNQAGISEVLNYPNPFSTRTQFVFTLTGSQVPDDVKIQIMTVTGTVVKEINEFELGPLRIGRNRSEYWWDGRDEFGDQLANGVYLYRVIARLNGEDLRVNSGTASQFFNEGFGKMYLLR